MTVQAALYGPALGFAFLLANYLSLAAVLRDRRSALWASLLISLGGNTSFWNRPDPVAGLRLDWVLHVPFHALSLATAQSLGWVLFLPCLALTHVAYQRFSRLRAVALGILLGVLFHAHTLTFVNACAAQLTYFVLVNALERPRRRWFRVWLVGLGGVAVAFAWLTLSRPVASFAALSRSAVPRSLSRSRTTRASASISGRTPPPRWSPSRTWCCSHGTPAL